MPLQSAKVRTKRKKEECSFQPQVLLDAEFLFGCHWGSPARPQELRSSQTFLDCAFVMATPESGGRREGGRGGRKGGAGTHRNEVFLGSSVTAEEGRARLLGLMGRTDTLRRDSWETGLGFPARRGWGQGPAIPKVGFRLGNTWAGVGGGGEGCRELRFQAGGEPQDGREGKGGSDSATWSQTAIQPSHREFIMARIASGDGAGSCLGSLSISDCDLLGGPHRRREGAQVSGRISEVQAQVPNAQGASFPHPLILLGLW